MGLEAGRESDRFRPESFGLGAGFRTHPDELAFTVCDEALTKDFEEKLEVPAWSASSSSYPRAGT